uniref:DUF4220 domain-containing protein n=1 Tax=Mesocestoides corti TaxID=53468 RepID=A0A5K3FR67_MESCO
MSTVIIGALYGLRESFYAPKGLWLLHFKTSGLSSSSHFVCRRSSATDPLLQPLHGQALRRLRLSAAMGEKRFSTGGAKSQSTESLNRLSSERPLYSADNILGYVDGFRRVFIDLRTPFWPMAVELLYRPMYLWSRYSAFAEFHFPRDGTYQRYLLKAMVCAELALELASVASRTHARPGLSTPLPAPDSHTQRYPSSLTFLEG